MLKQKSIIETATDNFSEVGQKVGLVLMAAAAVTGMLELPNHENSKIIVPNQPAFAFAGNNNDINPVRREKGSEEAGVTHVSYSIAQRTPGRFGKIK